MSRTAGVKSIAALDRFRAAWTLFGEESTQALEGSLAELQAFIEWLEHDQIAHWRQEIQNREQEVAEAKSELHRCLAATIDPNRTPSCYQEKKTLARAKARLEEAHEKLVAVKRWIPQVHQAVFEYKMRIEPLRGALASMIPEGSRHLQYSVDRLQAYVQAASAGEAPVPQGGGGTEAGGAAAAAPPPPADQQVSKEPADETSPPGEPAAAQSLVAHETVEREPTEDPPAAADESAGEVAAGDVSGGTLRTSANAQTAAPGPGSP